MLGPGNFSSPAYQGHPVSSFLCSHASWHAHIVPRNLGSVFHFSLNSGLNEIQTFVHQAKTSWALICTVLQTRHIEYWENVTQPLPSACVCLCMCPHSCLILWYLMVCSPPGSSVHGILQARILEWVAIPFSRAPSQPRDQAHVSCASRWILYHCFTVFHSLETKLLI